MNKIINFPIGYPLGHDNPSLCYNCRYYLGIANEKMCAKDICIAMQNDIAVPKKDFGYVMGDNNTIKFIKGNNYRYMVRRDKEIAIIGEDHKGCIIPMIEFIEDFYVSTDMNYYIRGELKYETKN